MFPLGLTTPEVGISWAQFEVDLAATLVDLADTGLLTLSLPERADDPRLVKPSWWRRIFGPEAPSDFDPWVQFFRLGNCLSCECGGPADGRLRGPVRISPAQQQQLTEIGWRPGWVERPTDPPHPNYRVYFPHHGDDPGEIPEDPALDLPYPAAVDASAAAQLAVDTFRDVFGYLAPGVLAVKRGVVGEFEGLIQEQWRKRKERREGQ
ncbi:MAG: TY-Chap domain-containing protein [Sporichthyaceae bacterium]